MTDLNTALGNGNDDFDFRALNGEELKALLRGEPTTETFSGIGNMMKIMHPELSQRARAEKQQAARDLKRSQVGASRLWGLVGAHVLCALWANMKSVSTLFCPHLMIY